MKLFNFLTILLVFCSHTYAQTSTVTVPTQPGKKTATQETPAFSFSGAVELSRGTSLYDYKDGTRSDDMSVTLYPGLSTPIGAFEGKIAYSKDLNNEESVENGFSDLQLSYALSSDSFTLYKNDVRKLVFSPALIGVVPVSDVSVKKNQLQGALSLSVGLGLSPVDKGFIVAAAVTAGRSFHQYEEDINGQVLNQYLSNQTLSLGYTLSDWTFSFEYTNRSRWTYQGNIKQSFVATEEISYAFNDHFYTTVGHTNDAASVLKANGYESNVQLVDDNNSVVYLTLGLSI